MSVCGKAVDKIRIGAGLDKAVDKIRIGNNGSYFPINNWYSNQEL